MIFRISLLLLLYSATSFANEKLFFFTAKPLQEKLLLSPGHIPLNDPATEILSLQILPTHKQALESNAENFIQNLLSSEKNSELISYEKLKDSKNRLLFLWKEEKTQKQGLCYFLRGKKNIYQISVSVDNSPSNAKSLSQWEKSMRRAYIAEKIRHGKKGNCMEFSNDGIHPLELNPC